MEMSPFRVGKMFAICLGSDNVYNTLRGGIVFTMCRVGNMDSNYGWKTGFTIGIMISNYKY